MPKLTVALCLPVYKDVEFDTFASLLELAGRWAILAPADWTLKLVPVRGSPVCSVRNDVARLALYDYRKDGGDVGPADVLLWNDSDNYLEDVANYIELVRRLIELPPEYAVLGVPVPVNAFTGGLIVNVRPLNMVPLRADGSMQEVERVGTGIVAVRADAFTSVPWPWFHFDYITGGERERYLAHSPLKPGNVESLVGEDVGFCIRLREAGRRIAVVTDMIAVHSIRRKCTLRADDPVRMENER